MIVQKSKPTQRTKNYIKITLQSTLLGKKYCVHKLISKINQYHYCYLALNVEDGHEYAVNFYRICQIHEDKEAQAARYRALKRAQILKNVNSPYVVKVYQIFSSADHLAIVEEYLGDQNLEDEMKKQKVDKDHFQIIVKHMYKAISAILQKGVLVKQVNFSEVFFKLGFFKLRNFPLFQPHHSNFLAPELQAQHQTITNKCDVWTLGIFYLRLLLLNKLSIQENQLQKLTNLFVSMKKSLQSGMSSSVSSFLQKCLSIDLKHRMSWEQLDDQPLLTKNRAQLSNKQSKIEMSKTIVIQNFPQDEKGCNSTYWSDVEILKTYFNEARDIDDMEIDTEKFNFEPLMRQDIKIYMQKKTNRQEQIYKILEADNFQAQKSFFIMHSIIKPLKKWIDLENRNTVTFFYLLSSRCFTNISYTFDKINKLSANQKQEYKVLIKTYETNVKPIYEEAMHQFDSFSKLLTQIENGFQNRIKDKLKNKKLKDQEDKFLTGIEGIDFEKQEQAQFTQKYFIPGVIKEIEKIKQQKFMQKILVISILTNYWKICQIQAKAEHKNKQFNYLVDFLIKQQSQMQKQKKQPKTEKTTDQPIKDHQKLPKQQYQNDSDY